MKMNKSKQHYVVTFNCNLEAGNIRCIDVWASTKRKAAILAVNILKKDSNIFTYTCWNVEAIKEG